MSNKSGPSWVDFANMTANIVQVGQLSAVSSRLRALEQFEVDREERVRLENELRQLVFDFEEALDNLSKYEEKAPLGVVVATQTIKMIIGNAEVTPSTFQQFVDKDRVKKFQERLKEMEEKCFSMLEGGDASQVNKFMPMAPFLSGLDKLIAALEARKQFDETEAQWKKLEEEKSSKVQVWDSSLVISFLLLLGSVLLAFLAPFFNVASFVGNELAIILYLSCCLAVPVLMFAMIFIYVSRSNAIPKEHKDLEQIRKALRGKFLLEPEYKKICDVFGYDLGIDAYKRLNEEIKDFLSRALQYDKAGTLLHKSLIEIAFPKTILDQVSKDAK